MLKLLKCFLNIENIRWCFDASVRCVHRAPNSFQALCPSLSIAAVIFPSEHRKRTWNLPALNTWAHLPLNRICTSFHGDANSRLHLSSAFTFGWSPNLPLWEPPVIFPFIGKSDACVVRRTWNWWSLWVPSNCGCSVILWFYLFFGSSKGEAFSPGLRARSTEFIHLVFGWSVLTARWRSVMQAS